MILSFGFADLVELITFIEIWNDQFQNDDELLS